MRKLTLLYASLACCALAAGCESNLPVDAADKAILLRAADLVPYGYGMVDLEKYETFTKTRYFDGSREIQYEFETPESEQEHVLYMNVTVTIEQKQSDAWISQGAEGVGMKYGLKAGGIEQKEIKDFYKYGDASSFYVLEKDGRPIGNLFTVRDGKRLYTLVMSGLYFDDAATWKELIEEKLRKFSAYTPG
jgi:hypothetical protein